MKKYWILLLVLALIFAYNAPINAKGVASGTNIDVGGDAGSANQADAPGDIVGIYTSSAGNDTTYRSPGYDTATVISIFGDTAYPESSEDTAASGNTVTVTINVYNDGNIADMYLIDTGWMKSTYGSGGWGANDTVTIYVGGVKFAQGNPGDTLNFWITGAEKWVGYLSPDGDTSVDVEIYYDSASEGAWISFDGKAIADSGTGGEPGGYTGYNSTTYAGAGDDTFAILAHVGSAIQANVYFAVAYDSMISPASYSLGAADTIPGGKAQVAITYDNDGTDTATNFIVTAALPDTTNYVEFDTATVAMADVHTGGSITNILYSTNGSSWSTTAPANTAYIRWYISDVAKNNGDAVGTVESGPDVDAGTVRYTVIIQ